MRAIVWIALVCVFIPALVAAQVAPPPKPLHLRGDHWTPYDPPTEFPEGVTVHIIQQGDTLWDLAAQHLGDPYLWPQIWERNPYIQDSHWIYPGDPLVIDVAVQQAQVPPDTTTPIGEEETVVSEFQPDRPGQDFDDYDEVTARDAIPLPLGSSADVYCFARLVEDENEFQFAIRSSERIGMQDHFSEGDVVYMDGGVNQGVQAGDRFFILGRNRELRHPVSGAAMGRVYVQNGQLRVLCAQENTAIAEITLACDPVAIGDVLQPFSPVPVPLVIRPDPTDRCDEPNGKPTGYLVYTKDDVIDNGSEQLVFVDLGSAEGLYPGMFATVFQDNPVAGMPRLVIGEIGILTVEESYSTAKITHGWTPVGVGDRIEIK
jgi:hypothetical protein